MSSPPLHTAPFLRTVVKNSIPMALSIIPVIAPEIRNTAYRLPSRFHILKKRFSQTILMNKGDIL